MIRPRAIIPLLLLLLLHAVPSAAQINTERMMIMGRNALYFEDYVLSIQYFNKVISAKPYLHEPYFFRGLAKYYLDDFMGAESDLDAAIEKNPYVSRSYQLRGMCRAKRDSLAAASADFRMAIKYDPQNPILWQNLAATAMQGEQWNDAAMIVDSLLLFAPRYTDAYLMRVHIAVKQGDSLMARRMADEAVRVDAYSSDVYEMRAIVEAEYGNYAAGEENMTRAIELMPGRGNSYINRALMRYHLNNLRGAMDDYNMALYVEPADFVGHYNRGILRMQLGDDNKAIEDFDFVLDVDPDNTMARFNRALLREQTGDLRGAISDYTRVLADYPNFEYGYQCRASALRKVGDVDAAMADEAWLMNRMTAMRNGQLAADTLAAGNDKTRARSDRNVRNYNKMIASETGLDKNYVTEYRGKVQNRNLPVEPEPMFVLTYYEDMQEEVGAANRYSELVDALNDGGRLPYKALLTNNERALASNEVERHFASIDAQSKNIADNPADPYYRVARAIDSYLVQDFPSAIADLDAAAAIDSALWCVNFVRAFVRYKQLESERLNEVNARNDNFAVKRSVGLSIDYHLVKKDLDRVAESAPSFAPAFFNRGNVCLRMSDFKAAVVDYSSAIELDDKFAEAYFNRGLAYIYLGNTELGSADLSKAGELGIYSAYNIIKRNKTKEE